MFISQLDLSDTDLLLRLAKEAKKAGNRRLVIIYCNNYKRIKLKQREMAQMDRDSKCAVG